MRALILVFALSILSVQASSDQKKPLEVSQHSNWSLSAAVSLLFNIRVERCQSSPQFKNGWGECFIHGDEQAFEDLIEHENKSAKVTCYRSNKDDASTEQCETLLARDKFDQFALLFGIREGHESHIRSLQYFGQLKQSVMEKMRRLNCQNTSDQLSTEMCASLKTELRKLSDGKRYYQICINIAKEYKTEFDSVCGGSVATTRTPGKCRFLAQQLCSYRPSCPRELRDDDL